MNPKSFSSGTSVRPHAGELEALNVQAFADLFHECHDITIEEHTLAPAPREVRVRLIYDECLSDLNRISEYLIPQLEQLFQKEEILTAQDLEQKRLFFMHGLSNPRSIDLISRQVFSGNLLLLFESLQCLYLVETSNPPNRDPEEPNTDVSIRGPRDGFIEDLKTNLALIRKRLKTPMLKYESYIAGTHTHTNIGLLYVKDLIDPKLVDSIRHKLSSLNSTGIVSGLQVEEFLSNSFLTLLPVYQYTGRPDYAVGALLKGRFVLLIDGSPTALIAPINFSSLLNTAEDVNSPFFSIAFVRLLRIASVMLSLFLPGFWVALVTYHQEQLPYTLIATIVIARQGVPLPAALEVLLVLLLFELFKEAGLRLPMAIGQTLSVVGGLIVGQAAIAAGLTSSGSLVIVAISVMATFTLTNQHLVGTLSIMRIAILVVCSFFGMFGFMMSLIAVLLYFANMRSFGVHYLAPVSPPILSDVLRILLRTPWRKMEGRPDMLDDPSVKGEEP